MNVTLYDDINTLLDLLLGRMHANLGENLVGLYLFGSLVWGDFDYDISDIDLLAATAHEIDEAEFAGLDEMHTDLVRLYPAWQNRLEIAYVSLTALQTFKTQRSTIGIISPGEPFHLKDAGADWLINWYVVQEKGLALYGPPPGSIIAPISQAEFIRAVREQAERWRGYVINARHTRPYQAYVILTLCRALYACTTGEQASKKQAGLWAQTHLPQWADLIRRALTWREAYRTTGIDHEATYQETAAFVAYVSDQIARL